MKNLALSIFVIFLLSGCFDSSPSKSEMKKAVLSQLKPCDFVALDDFEKVNGRKINDSHYSVDLKYTVVVSPIPAAKEKMALLASVEELGAKYGAVIKELEGLDAEIDLEAKKMSEENSKKSTESMDWCTSVGDEILKGSDFDKDFNLIPGKKTLFEERDALSYKLKNLCDDKRKDFMYGFDDRLRKWKDQKRAPLVEKRVGISGDLTSLLKQIDLSVSEIDLICRPSHYSGTRLDQLVFGVAQGRSALTTYAKGFSKSIEQTLIMEKTDNGWMLQGN